jgi:transcription initiation factor TFIIIB Brf1 subunit/transcription initiation factor TFIIB
MEECRSCKTTDHFVLDQAAGDVVCTACGLVAAERMIDERPLYDATRPCHQQGEPLLGTPGYSKPDARTRELTAARDFLMNHLERSPIPGVTHVTVVMALAIYNTYLDSLGRDRAAVREDARNRVLLGSLCHAAATTNADVDTKQIGTVFETGSVDVSMGANRVARALETEPVLRRVHVPSITGMVFTYAPRLSLPRDVRRVALALARRIEVDRKRIRALKPYRPASLAAGILWRAISRGSADHATLPTQDVLATVTGVSKTTFIAAERVISSTDEAAAASVTHLPTTA